MHFGKLLKNNKVI